MKGGTESAEAAAVTQGSCATSTWDVYILLDHNLPNSFSTGAF